MYESIFIFTPKYSVSFARSTNIFHAYIYDSDVRYCIRSDCRWRVTRILLVSKKLYSKIENFSANTMIYFSNANAFFQWSNPRPIAIEHNYFILFSEIFIIFRSPCMCTLDIIHSGSSWNCICITTLNIIYSEFACGCKYSVGNIHNNISYTVKLLYGRTY